MTQLIVPPYEDDLYTEAHRPTLTPWRTSARSVRWLGRARDEASRPPARRLRARFSLDREELGRDLPGRCEVRRFVAQGRNPISSTRSASSATSEARFLISCATTIGAGCDPGASAGLFSIVRASPPTSFAVAIVATFLSLALARSFGTATI
jgi:hypothetical protein